MFWWWNSLKSNLIGEESIKIYLRYISYTLDLEYSDDGAQWDSWHPRATHDVTCRGEWGGVKGRLVAILL